MSVERAQAEISSAEFSYWIAYANEEPFGFPMDNYRMGVPAAAIVNTIRSTIPMPKGKQRPKQLKASDLYPREANTAVELTPKQREHIRKKQAKRAKK